MLSERETVVELPFDADCCPCAVEAANRVTSNCWYPRQCADPPHPQRLNVSDCTYLSENVIEPVYQLMMFYIRALCLEYENLADVDKGAAVPEFAQFFGENVSASPLTRPFCDARRFPLCFIRFIANVSQLVHRCTPLR
jgi:hypothetical protein